MSAGCAAFLKLCPFSTSRSFLHQDDKSGVLTTSVPFVILNEVKNLSGANIEEGIVKVNTLR
jgi:hypothetical protein